MSTTRPNMTAHFKGRINWHTHGMLAGHTPGLPSDVTFKIGDVTDPVILIIDRDGDVHAWHGGRTSARKRHGCYPPLMPIPVPTTEHHRTTAHAALEARNARRAARTTQAA